MSREELNELSLEELETRAAQVAEETRDADAETLEALNEELGIIEERKAQMNAEIEERKAAAAAVVKGAGKVLEEAKEKTMTEKEVRSSQKYIDAYVDYLKGKNDGTECRALLTELAEVEGSSGPVPIPVYVENKIETAWERDEIMSRVSKTYLKGIDRVAVEMSATGASIHEEGTEEPDEEAIKLAIVQIIPHTIKKWIPISTEAMDLKGEAFLDYIYDEIEYQIVKKASELALSAVTDASTTGTNAPTITNMKVSDLALTDIVTAVGNLSSGARNLVFVANRATIAAYKALAINANYAVDPFAGVTAISCDSFAAFDNAEGDAPFAIVGDLAAIRANYPNGDEVKFVFDEYSLAEKDLIKIVGRQLVGVGLVRDKAFCVLTKKSGQD